VAGVITRALGARYPRPRYLVGVDAAALTMLDMVTPTTVKDVATRLGLGL
jgi:hypothetical protein